MSISNLYRAIWRWHFYAGLLTLPFLVSLAVTGGIYLYKDEINALLHRDLLQVERSAPTILPHAQLIGSAAGALGGEATGYLPPDDADRSARVFVTLPNGAARDVFVDPYTASVLGDLPHGDYNNLPFIDFVRHWHSLETFGRIGKRVIEIVAGWILILVLTGIYLWWPRGQAGSVVTVRRNAGRRTFWRDLHAVTGVFAAVVIFFLAATGLPWSGFWGETLKNAMNDAGLGYPPSFWFPIEESTVPLNAVIAPAPWTVANSAVPTSGTHGAPVIGIDAAIGIFEREGIAPGYTVALPRSPAGVYSAAVIPDRIEGARAVHLDQYSGEILFDVTYADLGPAARMIEFGSSVHTGQEYGSANPLLMLVACLSIIVMSVSAIVMWWKRRPSGSLGAPRCADGYRVPKGLIAILVAMGVVFPLVGLSIIAMLALDLVMPLSLRSRLA
jgi:uncharacterized iron-regulated membrane protein